MLTQQLENIFVDYVNVKKLKCLETPQLLTDYSELPLTYNAPAYGNISEGQALPKLAGKPGRFCI